MDYPHARVRLHFCKVFHWRGEFQMREGQAMAWETLPVRSRPVLPGTVPVLRWFADERAHHGPTHSD
jgi:8-oxo-dGTP diphosphatase